MKVHATPRPGSVERSKPAEPSGERREAGPASRGERVHVSNEAQALGGAREPEAPDELRVARLKEAIRSGAFVIDADRIAEAMLNEEL